MSDSVNPELIKALETQEAEDFLSEDQIPHVNGMRVVTVDLAAEGKAIHDILVILQAQPRISRDRVWDTITNLINPAANQKSNLQYLAESFESD